MIHVRRLFVSESSDDPSLGPVARTLKQAKKLKSARYVFSGN